MLAELGNYNNKYSFLFFTKFYFMVAKLRFQGNFSHPIIQQVVLAQRQQNVMIWTWIQRVKTTTGVPKPQCPEGLVRLDLI